MLKSNGFELLFCALTKGWCSLDKIHLGDERALMYTNASTRSYMKACVEDLQQNNDSHTINKMNHLIYKILSGIESISNIEWYNEWICLCW